LIYLDTHVVVWLYAGLTNKLSEAAKNEINNNDIFISPICRLELQYLYEIDRISDEPESIISELSSRIGLNVCDKNFDAIATFACTINWTRDPFDRMITANAALQENRLITRDQVILGNYEHAVWKK
jgi:PIN domain nuclease of toxin-antitoxin system